MPSRGEVWMVDLGMIQKVRPALILNRSFKDEDRTLITVIPHTTALRGSELEIRFNVPFLQPGAFLVQKSHYHFSGEGRAIPGTIDNATIGVG